MKPLFEISNDYLKFMDYLSDIDEIREEDIYKIKEIESSFEECAVNIGLIIKMLDIEYNAISSNIESQEKRRSSVYKKIERLKKYVKEEMERVGTKVAKNSEVALKIKVNPPSVVLDDESLIPEKYFLEKRLLMLDKTHVSRDLKNNISVPGAHLEQKTRVEIL